MQKFGFIYFGGLLINPILRARFLFLFSSMVFNKSESPASITVIVELANNLPHARPKSLLVPA